MTEPNHSIDDVPTVYFLDPAALGIDDDPLTLGSRSPVGTYAFVSDTPEAAVEADVPGEHRSPAGAYAYAGNAFGTGGLRHVRRHRRVAAGNHDARHWYIDYFGGYPSVGPTRVVCVTDRDVERAVAAELTSSSGSVPIDDFGSSDCPCDTHLTCGDSVETVMPLVEAAFRSKM